MKQHIHIFVFSILMLVSNVILGADKPVLKFEKNKILIGEPVKVSLLYKHHKEKEVLFPDTLYDFSPFEFVKKDVFPTITKEDISTDSVVYTLSSFNINRTQNLTLPIFIFSKHDTVSIFSNTETIQIQRLVSDSNPDLELKSNTKFQTLETSFDYIFWIVTILGISFIVGISYLIFGKRVRRQIKLYLSKLAHDKFISDFERTIIQLNKRKSNADLDKLLGIWKKYLQTLTNKPTTTYTSKEISEFVNNEKLSNALNNIDRAIYGGEFKVEVINETTILKIVAKEYYIKKQEEVKNDD